MKWKITRAWHIATGARVWVAVSPTGAATMWRTQSAAIGQVYRAVNP